MMDGLYEDIEDPFFNENSPNTVPEKVSDLTIPLLNFFVS